MADSETTAMDEAERDAALGDGGTGVVSFGTGEGEAPHSIPVSYGYDSADGIFYFRLAVGPESEKRDVLDDPVSFVVYDSGDDGWWSVVVTGTLERTTEEGIETETLRGLERVNIPLVDIFGRPPGEVPFEFFRLVPEEWGARKETKTRL